MSSRLSLIIAASAIGLKMGIITPGMNSSFILLAVITCLLSPVIYNQLNPINPLTGSKTIIVGGSSTGVLLARRLQMHGRTAVIIENNKERYKEMKSKGLPVQLGNGLDPGIYRELKLHPGNYVVVETGSDNVNLSICELLKKEFHHENLISKSGTSKIESALKRIDVELLDARRVLASTIESLIIRPTTYHTLVDTFENYRVEDVRVKNKNVEGLQVKDIPFHRDCTLILVTRGNDKYIPHGETFFRLGDMITVFGTGTALEDTRLQLAGDEKIIRENLR